MVYVEVEVRDRNGRLLKRIRKRSDSFVRNFMLMLFIGFTWGSQNIVKQDGSTVSISASADIGEVFYVRGKSGESNYGILVGSGTKSFSIDDYSLESKIPHGTSPGQLSYGESSIEGLFDDGTKLYFRVIRTFTNNSGSSITVSEVGLASKGNGNYPLIARDLLPSPVSVPDGSTLTVRYIIQYTYA